MCVGNLTNLWDARNKGVDVFTANFPRPFGRGFLHHFQQRLLRV